MANGVISVPLSFSHVVQIVRVVETGVRDYVVTTKIKAVTVNVVFVRYTVVYATNYH